MLLFKFLITGDNHLGLFEDQRSRKEQSGANFEFITFCEILQKGREENLDCILQVGDLFYDPKVTYNTLELTESVIKHYFPNTDTTNKKFNRDLFGEIPILAIDGNHDKNIRSPNDNVSHLYKKLESKRCINQFTKYDIQNNKYIITPIIHKEQNVAIYGINFLSWFIKNDKVLLDKLNKEMDQIEFKDLNKKERFNILLLHQDDMSLLSDNPNGPFGDKCFNDYKDNFDLIVFGHIHEPIYYLPGTNRKHIFLRSGSTMRQSHSLTEKYIYIFELHKKDTLKNVSKKDGEEVELVKNGKFDILFRRILLRTIRNQSGYDIEYGYVDSIYKTFEKELNTIISKSDTGPKKSTQLKPGKYTVFGNPPEINAYKVPSKNLKNSESTNNGTLKKPDINKSKKDTINGDKTVGKPSVSSPKTPESKSKNNIKEYKQKAASTYTVNNNTGKIEPKVTQIEKPQTPEPINKNEDNSNENTSEKQEMEQDKKEKNKNTSTEDESSRYKKFFLIVGIPILAFSISLIPIYYIKKNSV